MLKKQKPASAPSILFALIQPVLVLLLVIVLGRVFFAKGLDHASRELIAISTCWSGLIVVAILLQGRLLFWLFFGLFWLCVLAEHFNFGTVGGYTALAYTGLAAAFLSLGTVLGYRSGARGWLSYWLLAVCGILTLAFVPASYLLFNAQFKVPVTPDVFYAIGQTHWHEAGDFVDLKLPWFWPVQLALAFVCIFICWLNLHRTGERQSRFLSFARTATGLTGVATFGISLWLSPWMNLFGYPARAAQDYAAQLTEFENTRERLTRSAASLRAAKQGKENEEPETYVIVIGESLNRDHMGVYGYPRDTTPKLQQLLDKGELLRFNNAYANHTHTVSALSLALTSANQYNGQNFVNSPSIVDLLNRAGFETSWITNQVLYGSWGNVVTALAEKSDELISLNKFVGTSPRSAVFDDRLVDELKKVLARKSNKHRAIFVHMMGNHEPYCDRYPPSFSVFGGKTDAGLIGAAVLYPAASHRINCYDNSVRYNDTVVASLIETLAAGDGVSALVYLADHSDDVRSGLGHMSARFTHEMIKTPLLIWHSPAYQNRYPELHARLEGNQNRGFTNDLLFSTLLGWMNIRFNQYSTEFDLSSGRYTLTRDKLLTLHGERFVYSDTNYEANRKQNLKAIQSLNTQTQYLPHRVNSIGKLSDVLRSAATGFEMDLRWRDGFFEVGHDDARTSGLSLADFLSHAEKHENFNGVEKIWLDLKNLSLENAGEIVQRLNTLNTDRNLKGVLLLESPAEDGSLAVLDEAGFQTSFYIYASRVGLELDNPESKVDSEKLKSLRDWIAKSKPAGVSFDYRMLEFVEENLSDLFDEEVRLHTWDLSLSFGLKDFISRLKTKSYFERERVQTVLLSFPSPYSL